MAGIYIHIPFCRQACHYCNFHFSTSLKLQNDFTAALLKEITIRREYIGTEQVNTIYFGGGTPSLMPAAQLGAVMEMLHKTYSISHEAEVTFEANPDDLTTERLVELRRIGMNRLSIGIQSFFEEDLRWMNRAHNAEQARQCIDLAQDAGFGNMSIDLIYGGPTLTDERWLENLGTAVDSGVTHLSCYALTVEPGTALAHLTRKKQVKPVEQEDQARQFLLMSDFLQSNGYEHYEISNFAVPGNRSRHNRSYWSGDTYLGLGPSAHSFNGTSRQWNVSNNSLYIQSLSSGSLNFEEEQLTEVQRLNEYVMTALRTMEGIDLHEIASRFGKVHAEETNITAAKFKERGWLQNIADRLILTREGKLFADGIAAELFAEEDQTSTASILRNPSRG